MKRKENTRYIITASLIAAAYAGLTYLSSAFGMAYGPIQLRISEMLTVLPIFTPAAISGLTVGCFLANLGSFNMADLFFGTLATLMAALLTRLLKDFKIKEIPLFSLLSPVVINALVIGFEWEAIFIKSKNFLWGFLLAAVEIGVSQLIVCLCFGIPFYLVVKKQRIFK